MEVDAMSSASGMTQNAIQAEQANVRTTSRIMGELTDVAIMAHGSGVTERARGGEGHIGILNDKVIKFNTKFGERWNLDRTDPNYNVMFEASEKLRERLKSLALDVVVETSTAISPNAGKAFQAKILRELGYELDEHGGILGNRETRQRNLLDRKTAAKAVTLIRDQLKKAVRAKEPKLSEAESALLKKGLGKETANYDFHIWRKVRAMSGLTAQAVDNDGFARVRLFGAVEKEVARVKMSLVEDQGVRKEFAQVIRETGNAKMKEALGPILVQTHALEDGAEKIKSNVLGMTDPVDSTVGHGMLRLVRAQALAKSMDAMFVKMMALYDEKRRAEGRPEVLRPDVLNGLGQTPVTNILKRSLAKLLNRPEQQIDVNNLLREQTWLSPNEYENLKALMRDELLAFAARQDIELVRERPDAELKVSGLVTLTKDLFRTCALTLDQDVPSRHPMRAIDIADTYDYQGERPLADIEGSGQYVSADIGSRKYKTGAWTIFHEKDYGVDANMRRLVAEADRQRLIREAENGEVERNLENLNLENQDLANISVLADPEEVNQ